MITDRDQSIERLLRRARSADSVRDCPDPETLAALADDTLTAAARREVEAHVADCHQCQMVTAAMVRADVPTASTTEAAGDVAAWRRRAFNWLVPAAAAATAIALWVLVPGQRTPLPEQPASEAPLDAAPPPLSSETITSEPLQLPADSSADSRAAERDGNVALGRARPSEPPASPAPQTGAAGEIGAVRENAEARGDALGAAAQNNPSAEAAGQRQERRSSELQTPAALPPPAAAALRAPPLPSFEVASPTPQIRWRIGPNAVVQYSTDGGTTWTLQPTGVSVEFIAGSAPTVDVLWLVGRQGIVLRTIDGGKQWQRTAFPEALDLVAIAASTGLDALVTLADGRRFRTTDGGRTWVLIGQ